MAEETTDDLEASINETLQPDDEYALKCKLCNKIMKLEHNIHTIVLLFQFYKCSCPLIDRHIIVRDKRMNESVVHQSKGIYHVEFASFRRDIISDIVVISYIYYSISHLTDEASIDAPLDLIVAEHMLDDYEGKYDDIKDDTDRLDDSESLSSIDNSLLQPADSDNATAVKHMIRLLESLVSCRAFAIWFNRLLCDTCTAMIVSTMAYMEDVYVRWVAAHELNDYNALMDMISCMLPIIERLRKKATDGKYVMPDDARDERNRLINTLNDDDQLTYAQFKHLLQCYIERNLSDIDVTDHSMSNAYDSHVSPIDKFEFTSNVIESNIRWLATNIVEMLLRQLSWMVFMAKHAFEIEKHKLQQQILRDRLSGKS